MQDVSKCTLQYNKFCIQSDVWLTHGGALVLHMGPLVALYAKHVSALPLHPQEELHLQLPPDPGDCLTQTAQQVSLPEEQC